MKKIRLIIFAKAPIAGFAKTRLIPALGAAGAANLAQRLLLFTLKNGLEANVGITELCVTPKPEDAFWNDWPFSTDVCWSDQGEGDLGVRLARASQRAVENGESVLLIGTDCPQLSPKILQRAAKSLQDFNAVIIPATDGGYTLLGFNEFNVSLFKNIVWSSNSVFSETMQRINDLHWHAAVMNPLHDIDEQHDLCRLPDGWPEKTNN